jgi:hypothetical protein
MNETIQPSQGGQILRAALRLVEEHKTGRMAAVIHRLFAPYCVKFIGDRALPLNRQYKPLGLPPDVGFVEYAEFVSTHGIPVADLPSELGGGATAYLYKEGANEPWAGARHLAAYRLRVSELFGI